MSREQLLQSNREQFDAFVQQVTNGRKLTKEERSEVSRQRKLIKNRKTAAASRQRKKEHQNQVQESIDILTQDQELHREELAKLETDNERLRNEISYMQQLIQQNSVAQAIWNRQELARKQWHLASPGVKVLARYLLIMVFVAHMFFLQAPLNVSSPQTVMTAPVISPRVDSPVLLPAEMDSPLPSLETKMEIPELPVDPPVLDAFPSMIVPREVNTSLKEWSHNSFSETPSQASWSALESWSSERSGPSMLNATSPTSQSESIGSPTSSEYSWTDSSPCSTSFSDEESEFSLGVLEPEEQKKEGEPEDLQGFQDWLDEITMSESNGTASFGDNSTFQEFYSSFLASSVIAPSLYSSPQLSHRDHLPY